MIKDQINSQLTVIESMSNLREIQHEEAHQARDYITKSVSNISASPAKALRRFTAPLATSLLRGFP